MATVSIKFFGVKELQRDLKAAGRRFPQEKRRRLARSAERVVREAQNSFSDGWRTRAKYVISGGKRKRRKPPLPVTAEPWRLAKFSGAYRQQISYELRGGGRRHYAVIGPVGIKYARVHEFGTHGQRRRPVMGRGLQRATPFVERILGGTFSAVLK